MSLYSFSKSPNDLTFSKKFLSFGWLFLLLVGLATAAGVVGLYSAGGGDFTPWAGRHVMRFCMGIVIVFFIALIDIKIWLKSAYFLHLIAIMLLVAVAIEGRVGMGAQRWIDLYFMQLQPSEIAKITLVMAVARYFHMLGDDRRGWMSIIWPGLLVIVPTGLVVMQPDLGTALILLALCIVMLFLGGLSWWFFVIGGVGAIAAIPVGWAFMEDYQKQRVLTFLNPESDPLGAGWNITQSKIALGSGGLHGKGFLEGTQSHLDFLPEAHTDFIFTLLAEEWGFIGALSLIVLFAVIIFYGYATGFRSRSSFGRLLCLGLATNLFFYVFINTAMVMGLIPVVGVPLPLVSYGGTAMLATMISAGLIINVLIHRDARLGRGES